MTYRPFRSLGRFVLAACAVSLGAASLGAQTASPNRPGGVEPFAVRLFHGLLLFWRPWTLQPAGIAYSSIDLGAIGSGAYYFNQYFGGEFIYSTIRMARMMVSPSSVGPIFRAPMENFTLFAHGLVGGCDAWAVRTARASVSEHEPYQWGPALTAGGGMDYDLPFFDNRFSLRLFQADYRYIHANFRSLHASSCRRPDGWTRESERCRTEHGYRGCTSATSFRLLRSPTPARFRRRSGYPGDPITVTGTAAEPEPEEDGDLHLDCRRRHDLGHLEHGEHRHQDCSPGTYTVTGHVTEGTKPGQSADCSGQFTVNAVPAANHQLLGEPVVG